MANTVSGFGFRSFGHQDGSAPTMGLQRMFIASSDANVICTGDVVAFSTAATLAGYVTNPSTSSLGGLSGGLAGVFAGCEYYNATLQRVVWSAYYPGSVSSASSLATVTAYVITDPLMQFIAQCSSTTLVGSSISGWNIGVASSLVGGGNTTTGQSALLLASSNISASSSLPFRIVDSYANFAPPGVNGTDTTAAGQILVVTPNNWMRNNTTGLST